PWLLALFGAGALWLVQVGFQRANAASVTAALTALDSLGPILAGFLLYHERWPAGGDRVLLTAGAATAVAGLTVLSARREAAEPAPDLPSGEPPPAARGLRAPVRLSIMRGAERGAGGAGKVAAATGRPPGNEDSEEIPGVPNGRDDLVSDSGMDVADRTFEAVVLYWDGLAGDAEVAAALRGRVAALRSAGAEVAIVSRTPVEGFDGQLLAGPEPAGRLRRYERGEGEHAADTTRRVLADLRTHGIGPELVLAAGAPDGEARALAEARVTVVPVRPALGPGSDPSALVGLLDEQLARRAARRVQGVDADPGWTVAVDGGDTRPRQVAETLLTVADGLLGTRGVREEDGAGPAPATVAAGVYDDRSETVPLLPGPGWTGLEVAAGAGRERRVLDLRSGVLWRERADDGAPLRTLRFSSLARPGVVALRAEGGPAVLRPGPALLPPGGEAGFEQGRLGDVTWARTRARRDGGITAAARQREGGGDRATVERIAAYVADPTGAPGPEEAAERLRAAEAVGFDQLLAEHRRAWAARWADAEVTIEGDPRSEQAVRFALFHLLANVADRGEAAVGARGLSGPAYAGHVFWDADVFVLPTLAATHPAAARAMLEYRVRRLPAARRIAADLGYAGARFPWESAADGNEVTPATTVDERGEVIE
ncbi:MAG TPA: hypothetical protein VEP73_06570, partial [Actinomycetota bacterium]|nr:hypothetical protein [Actinomycetota bacterium]